MGIAIVHNFVARRPTTRPICARKSRRCHPCQAGGDGRIVKLGNDVSPRRAFRVALALGWRLRLYPDATAQVRQTAAGSTVYR